MRNELLPLHHYHNVIIDIDGTMVDSNDAHAHAFIDAFEANGITSINFNDIRRLIGMSGKEILAHVLDEQTFRTLGEKIEEDKTRIFTERYRDQIKPHPDVLVLLEFLRAEGMKVALSSASPQQTVDYFIDKLAIRSFIEGTTSSEDIPEGKPNPLAIEVCCQKFGFVPTETVMIGDSPYDIISADEFLIPTIGVLTGGYTEDELLKTGAVAVYNTLGDVYTHFQQSILSK